MRNSNELIVGTMPMSRMLYQDKDGEWIAAGSKDWMYQSARQVIVQPTV